MNRKEKKNQLKDKNHEERAMQVQSFAKYLINSTYDLDLLTRTHAPNIVLAIQFTVNMLCDSVKLVQ